jgi:CheY-like chemotaxis protein
MGAYERILLIEDDDDDRDFFIEVVRQINPSLQIAAFDAADVALEKLIAKEIIADIIFLDLNLPRMKGAEFLERIKRTELKKIPVIVLTTASDNETMQIIRKFGAKAFITKPGTLDELRRTLGAILKPIMYL